MKPIVLAILDGFGYREEEKGNAIKQANTPNFDYLWKTFPHSLLDASGEAVGLPKGQMGNSEVGHLNIGAGRIVYQPLMLINNKIKDKTFFIYKEFLDIIKHVKKNDSKLHLMGLVSDGGVHSHIEHLFALLELCKMENLKNVYIHVITDGRDTLPDSCMKYIELLQTKIEKLEVGKIASISGRYYAMDRDNRWDRIQKYYNIIVNKTGKKESSINSCVEKSFKNKIYDEFIEPCIINENGIIEDNDGLIFFNFRGDRANEILTTLTNTEFKEFKTKNFKNLKVVTMMPVNKSVIATHAFELEKLNNTFGEYISKLGYSQLRIAETEKYNHVTWFFDGNKTVDYPKEKKLLVSSPKVATYDLQPEMSANQVTNSLLKELDNDYDFVILNFANCDMVGHTGDMKATIKAVETVDNNLGKIYDKVKSLNGLLLVTADHGNAEYMIDSMGEPFTAHTTNKVPFIVCRMCYEVKEGKLGDIAPTMLSLANLDIPKEMTGKVIVK